LQIKKRFPHQTEATRFALLRGSAGFFMRMRCGKTLACLDTITHGRLHDGPTLIIAPVSVLASWENALLCDGVSAEKIVIIRSRPGWKPERLQRLLLNPKGLFFLINFEMVKRVDAMGIRSKILPVFGLTEWETVVVDESYRIANDESRVFEYLSRFHADPKKQRRFILSGAPASEHPINLASQFIFLDGSYFGCRTVGEYRKVFWEENKYTYKWKMKNPSHFADVLSFVHSAAYTTTLEDLGMGGVKLYRIDRVDITTEQMATLKWLSVATTYPNKKTGETSILDPLVRCTFESRISSGVHPITGEILSDAKAVHAAEMWRDKPAQTLVLSRFISPIEQAVNAFRKVGARVEAITGATPPAERERIRKAFQNLELDAVIAQLIPVKMGLDFSAADRIVYLSNSFSQDDRAQTEERAQHANRKTPYEVIDICTKDTHDEILTNVLTVKKESAILYTKAWSKEIVNSER